MDSVITKLQYGEILDVKYKDHALKGNKLGFRDCHILPDWILLYQIFEDKLILSLSRTGTHSDLLEI